MSRLLKTFQIGGRRSLGSPGPSCACAHVNRYTAWYYNCVYNASQHKLVQVNLAECQGNEVQCCQVNLYGSEKARRACTSPPVNNIWTLMIVAWNRTVLCYAIAPSHTHTHMNSSYRGTGKNCWFRLSKFGVLAMASLSVTSGRFFLFLCVTSLLFVC